MSTTFTRKQFLTVAGAGLGTLGLHPELARRMAREAGFGRFETLEIDHPVNAFYAVRP